MKLRRLIDRLTITFLLDIFNVQFQYTVKFHTPFTSILQYVTIYVQRIHDRKDENK